MNLSRQKNEFLDLISKYTDGSSSPEQRSIAEQYFEIFSDSPDILETLSEEELQQISCRLRSGIEEKIKKSKKTILFRYIIRATAAIFILIPTAIYLYPQSLFKEVASKSENRKMLSEDIGPGGQKAVLTLADGRKISLADISQKELIFQPGLNIGKDKDGELRYEKVSESGKGETLYNSIETPKGGEYRIVLPDGTKVWLNAASSLHYPLAFGGHARKVELEGEAYFEVTKDPARPFKVITASQEVEVLGTHFNVNAYASESGTTTTLIEGSVTVTNLKSLDKKKMEPGQQALISNDLLKLSRVDTDEAVAWTKGYFMFYNEPLENILNKISRWYDVDIVYQGKKNQKLFSGTVSRYTRVSQVLRKLELTGGIHFKIQERRIIVMQ